MYRVTIIILGKSRMRGAPHIYVHPSCLCGWGQGWKSCQNMLGSVLSLSSELALWAGTRGGVPATLGVLCGFCLPHTDWQFWPCPGICGCILARCPQAGLGQASLIATLIRGAQPGLAVPCPNQGGGVQDWGWLRPPSPGVHSQEAAAGDTAVSRCRAERAHTMLPDWPAPPAQSAPCLYPQPTALAAPRSGARWDSVAHAFIQPRTHSSKAHKNPGNVLKFSPIARILTQPIKSGTVLANLGHMVTLLICQFWWYTLLKKWKHFP